MAGHADDQIQKAIENGEFDNLPGMGRPFRFENDKMVPEGWRLAYRIMRDNDIQPEWIALQKELHAVIEKERRALQAAYARWRVAEDKQGRDLDSVRERLAQQDRYEESLTLFRLRVKAINRKINTYNLKVPNADLAWNLLDEAREIARITGP